MKKKPRTVVSENELVEHLLKADNVLHYLSCIRARKIKGKFSWRKINLDLDEWYRMLKKIMTWADTKKAREISKNCDEWLAWKAPKNHPLVKR